MSQTAPPNVPPAAVDASTRFLVELENTWTLLRVYGTEHPAFRRSADAAAAAIDRPARVSVNPRGFSPTKPGAPNETLQVFAQRLRAMGLVGLAMEPGLTAAQVIALVLVLSEADRGRGNADVVVEKIASSTGGHVRAVPLRLDSLRLVEGTSGTSDAPESSDIWREMFSSAFRPGSDTAESAELARAFENALRGQSSGQWDSMVGVWMKQLASIDPAVIRQATAARGHRGVGATQAGIGNGPGGEPAIEPGPGDAGSRASSGTGTIDSVATFLATLSPVLCQRLLKETVSTQTVSEPVVLALADRLPAGVVLGALANVDRTNGAPSTAALALLRKMSANVTGASVLPDASPTTGAELAEVASTLERLLGTTNEHQFVPEEYLQRRQELSHHALTAEQGRAVAYPAEAETARHAAGLAFEILAAPDSAVADLTAALAFVTERVSTWIRTGQFALAREAMSIAATLVAHEDPSVAKPAQALVSASVNADDLLQGAGHRTDRAAAVAELADLLRQSDGTTLATLLSTVKPVATDPVLEAFRRVLPDLPAKSLEGLFRAISSTPPPALLALLSSMKGPDAIKAVQLIAAYASGPTRRAVVHVIFRRDFRWPMTVIDQFLKDDESEIRRIAVMKLVSDADLATAAGVLAAASKIGKYDADVALGLAELLRHHRHHPDVRPAWRQWAWSKRWWVALLFVNIGTPRRAA